MNIRYERVTINDIEEQLRLQKEAFSPLLEKYQDGDFNPANSDREKILKRISAGVNGAGIFRMGHIKNISNIYDK